MCELIISSLSLLCVYACMYTCECKHVFILTCEYCVNMYVCVYVCIFIYMGVYTLLYVCVHVYLCARVGMWMCVWFHVFGCVTAFQTRSCDPNSVMGDSNLCCYGPDTLAIRRTTHGMSGDSYQFVQWRPDGDLDPKLRHFMWVFAFVLFPYLPLSIGNCVLLVSFHVIVWFILPVWLCVSLHEVSVSVHFNYIAYQSAYQHHFMC